ncbi:unnamed protein product, partial [marine sediment metagenome]
TDGTEVDAHADSGYNTYSQTWTKNPADGEAWEWADIDTLEIGIGVEKKDAGSPICTQVYVEIDYTPPPPVALPGWPYRNQITLNGAANAGTYYQVRLKVGESAGTPGADFHMGGFCADFPNDIRFTSSDGNTELFHWLEGLSGSAPNRLAIFWVLVSEHLSTNKDIYVYCGKPGQPSASNASYTFRFYEDIDTFSVTSRVSKTSLITGARSYGMPYLCDILNGTWAMVYRDSAAMPDGDPDSRTRIRFSEDEGVSWTADDTFTDGNPVVGFPINPPDAN